MVGDGIRSAFAVTGTAVAGSANAEGRHRDRELQDVRRRPGRRAGRAAPTAFVAAVKAGDVARPRPSTRSARHPWERIEPVAECFGDLDPKIDGREDVVNEGMAFTGYHRLEKDLWVDGLQADSSAIADQLLADVNEIVAQAAATVDITGSRSPTGAKALLDEVATGKITGEEERYSHTDLWDFDGNVEGSQAAVAALRPLLQEKDPALLATLDTEFADAEQAARPRTARRTATSATPTSRPTQIKALTVALDAVERAGVAGGGGRREGLSTWAPRPRRVQPPPAARAPRPAPRWSGSSAARMPAGRTAARAAGRGVQRPPASPGRPVPRRAPGRHRHPGPGPAALRRARRASPTDRAAAARAARAAGPRPPRG